MKIYPCIKWAGGKTQLLDEIITRLPKNYNNYYEPFIGGASVLFAIQPSNATINDYNPQLINLYTQIRDNVDDVISLLSDYGSVDCTQERYYDFRNKYNEKISQNLTDNEAAALFIFLNKHCFNGLYRVNSKGLFNVPWNNRKDGKSCDPDNLKAISTYLKTVRMSCSDFEVFCDDIQPGDFVYFDSPYVPESVTADFTSYTSDGFGYEDHVRLASLYKKLSDKGAYLMLSNNDVDLVRKLYEGFNIESIDVKRMINRNANKRTGKEVIITNY